MADVIDIAKLVLELRPDLRRRFRFHLPGREEAWLAWLVTTGSAEYAALRDAPSFRAELARTGCGPGGRLTRLQHLVWLARPDVRKAFPLPARTEGYRGWFYTHGLEEHGYWAYLSEAERRMVRALSEPWRSRIRAVAAKSGAEPEPRIAFEERPFGVNLIGYAYGELGIGEDVRMAARALLAAKVPLAMLDFPPGADVPQNDRSMARHVVAEGPYRFNLFCMTALESGRYYAERGSAQFAGRYNIGYWPWELGRWPKEWEAMCALVDEVWVSSTHTRDALAPVCTKALRVMPMAVELGTVRAFAGRKPARTAARAHFALPARAKLFCFAFDLNSSVHRKNPQACIEAFLRAFPKKEFSADKVGLVIKAHRPAKRNADWEKLKSLAKKDARIRVIEGTLPRAELLALYAACDCFVSLHRAEGFGRGIAEALQLGLHVIATGYSGNADFCRAPHADRVRYRLVKVKKGQYPYGADQVWAEADVAHAAELMRAFALRKTKPAPGDWRAFSAAVVGARYARRLRAIGRGAIISKTVGSK